MAPGIVTVKRAASRSRKTAAVNHAAGAVCTGKKPRRRLMEGVGDGGEGTRADASRPPHPWKARVCWRGNSAPRASFVLTKVGTPLSLPDLARISRGLGPSSAYPSRLAAKAKTAGLLIPLYSLQRLNHLYTWSCADTLDYFTMFSMSFLRRWRTWMRGRGEDPCRAHIPETLVRFQAPQPCPDRPRFAGGWL